MMRFHSLGVDDPEMAVTEGLGLVQAVTRTLGEENPYAKAICWKRRRLSAAIESSQFTTISARR